ncbi:type III secretion system subunit [Burkholderia sp. Bp9126]|nr:type III secretion system subunit [Burkholderia sp. Bp9126]
MHDDWWAHLGLEAWRDNYRRYPTCRSAIDRLIVMRRGYPVTTLPGALDDRQHQLLAVESRIGTLIIALGAIALDCADYLLMKAYRDQLASHLGGQGCAQLLALHAGWRSTARVSEPSCILDAATSAGIRWWQRDAGSCIVSTLLGSRLPPFCAPPAPDELPAPTGKSAADTLLKIARFL